MHIEFTKNHGAYSPGDVAGFPPNVAEVLVQKGVAVRKQWGPAPKVDASATGPGDTSPTGPANTDDAGQGGPDDKPVRGRRK